jgi:hypothetical protein
MTDAEFDEERARIMRFADKWTPLLGLDDWDISWEFHREPDTTDAKEMAYCGVQWQYEAAVIRWCVFEVYAHALNDDALERVVVHEMMHILLHEMREDANRPDIAHEERVATRLTKAFVRTSERGEPA